jgi:hypothetical protein
MTVIKCALCGHQVDEAAGACLKCGWPVDWGAAEPRKSRKSPTALPLITRRPTVPSTTTRRPLPPSTRSWWLPLATILMAVLAWAAYTVLSPSAPPPGDRDAGARLGEPPEDSTAAATPSVGSVPSQEPNSRTLGRVDQPPQSGSPNVGARQAPATNSNGGTSPEEPALRAWRTADGKLYFGIAPPPGSVKIENFGKPAAPKSTPPPP